MSASDNGKDSIDPLLDDQSFAKLMESEWEASGSPVDEMATVRVWNRMQRKITRPARRRWQLPALLAACFLGVLIAGRSFWLPGDDLGQQYKGTLRASDVQIGFRTQGSEGDLLPWDIAQRQAGDVVLPYVESKVPVVIVLLRKASGISYELVAGPEPVAPGDEHFFSSGDHTLAIQLEKDPETYCILVGTDAAAVTPLVSSLPTINAAENLESMDCFAL